jgi:hypothetical protein
MVLLLVLLLRDAPFVRPGQREPAKLDEHMPDLL